MHKSYNEFVTRAEVKVSSLVRSKQTIKTKQVGRPQNGVQYPLCSLGAKAEIRSCYRAVIYLKGCTVVMDMYNQTKGYAVAQVCIFTYRG